MKIWSKILMGIIIILLIIQIPVFNPEKNYTEADAVNAITTKYEVPMDVQMHLYNACYNCHSNYTEYPWYYNIQPISWWMDHHIDEAKAHLNFSEFASYSPQEAAHAFHEIQEVMEHQVMPLEYYTKMHEKAQLTDEEYKAVAEWAGKMSEKLLSKTSLEKNQAS